jgi:DNA-binding CsgD family transcriptional regulator
MEPAGPFALRVARRGLERSGARSNASNERFVGRQPQLDLFRERFEDAASGHGSIVLVGGEAGIGKSRLTAECLRFARARGARAASGSCLDFAPAPFAPFLDALHELGAVPPSDAADWSRADKRARLETLAGALRELARAAPLVVAIEDVHWADESTRDFIRFMRDHVLAMRLVLVATYRDDEMRPGHPLRATLAALQPASTVWPTLLGPLDDFEMKALLRNAVEGRRQLVAEHLGSLKTLAEGNPFVAEELLKNLFDVLERGVALDELPLSLGDAVVRRLEQLNPDERAIVAAAAAVGREFDSELLARIAAQSQDAVRGALRRGIALGLIVERPAIAGRYAFRHALTQRIVLGDLLAEEAREYHALIAAALESQPDASTRAVELAHHWWEAREPARAARYAERAGDAAAAAGLTSDAAANYERALAAETLAPRVRAELARKLGDALARAGRPEAARAHGEAAYGAFSELQDREGAALAALSLAAIAYDLDDMEGARRFAELALSSGDGDVQRVARVRSTLAAGSDSELRAVLREAEDVRDVQSVRELRAGLALAALAALCDRPARDALSAFERALSAAGEEPRLRFRAERAGSALAAALESEGALEEALGLYRRLGLVDAALRVEPALKNRQGRKKDELTKREREISGLIAAGKTNRVIAEELFVSERTVEDHVGSMLRKLGLKNRAELAAHVTRGG